MVEAGVAPYNLGLQEQFNRRSSNVLAYIFVGESRVQYLSPDNEDILIDRLTRFYLEPYEGDTLHCIHGSRRRLKQAKRRVDPFRRFTQGDEMLDSDVAVSPGEETAIGSEIMSVANEIKQRNKDYYQGKLFDVLLDEISREGIKIPFNTDPNGGQYDENELKVVEAESKIWDILKMVFGEDERLSALPYEHARLVVEEAVIKRFEIFCAAEALPVDVRRSAEIKINLARAAMASSAATEVLANRYRLDNVYSQLLVLAVRAKYFIEKSSNGQSDIPAAVIRPILSSIGVDFPKISDSDLSSEAKPHKSSAPNGAGSPKKVKGVSMIAPTTHVLAEIATSSTAETLQAAGSDRVSLPGFSRPLHLIEQDEYGSHFFTDEPYSAQIPDCTSFIESQATDGMIEDGLFASPKGDGRALCEQSDPDSWFPEWGEGNKDNIEMAKKVCGRCDVRARCLAYALKHGERYGIWGGLTENERHQMRLEVV